MTFNKIVNEFKYSPVIIVVVLGLAIAVIANVLGSKNVEKEESIPVKPTHKVEPSVQEVMLYVVPAVSEEFESSADLVGKYVHYHDVQYLLLGITANPEQPCMATLLNYDKKVPCEDIKPSESAPADKQSDR